MNIETTIQAILILLLLSISVVAQVNGQTSRQKNINQFSQDENLQRIKKEREFDKKKE